MNQGNGAQEMKGTGNVAAGSRHHYAYGFHIPGTDHTFIPDMNGSHNFGLDGWYRYFSQMENRLVNKVVRSSTASNFVDREGPIEVFGTGLVTRGCGAELRGLHSQAELGNE
jgi:hypothetical protein